MSVTLARLGIFVSACWLAGSTADASVLITVDKSVQQMIVVVDGRPLYRWPVSTGRAGYDTPNGKFRATRLERDHVSREFDDAPMPFSIFFTDRGHAIHGSYDKRIGRPASHGCVRLSPANAETLFSLVEQEGVLNTTVELTGSVPSGAPAVARRPLTRQDENDPYGARPYPESGDTYGVYYREPTWPFNGGSLEYRAPYDRARPSYQPPRSLYYLND
jgi:hypothetical protein